MGITRAITLGKKKGYAMRLTHAELVKKLGLGAGETLEVDLGTGWNATLEATSGDRMDVDIGRPDGLFVRATTRTDPKNGMPRLVEEPTLGFEFGRPGMAYPVWLVGAVVCDDNLVVIPDKDRGRFSWSKAKKVWGEDAAIKDDGTLAVGGTTVGHIVAVFCSNKNRLVGPPGEILLPAGVAVVAPNPPKGGEVRVLEMEDMMFATLLQ